MKNSNIVLTSGSLGNLRVPAQDAQQESIGQLAISDQRISAVGSNGQWLNPINVGPLTLSDHLFTNCGATGRFGPSLEQVNAAYSGSEWVNASSLTVSDYGVQIVTIQETGLYRIKLRGATRSFFAAGEIEPLNVIELDVPLQAGWQLYIAVGQIGAHSQPNGAYFRCSTGSGGTFVWCPQFSTSWPIAIAGGGGASFDGKQRVTTPAVGTELSLVSRGSRWQDGTQYTPGGTSGQGGGVNTFGSWSTSFAGGGGGSFKGSFSKTNEDSHLKMNMCGGAIIGSDNQQTSYSVVGGLIDSRYEALVKIAGGFGGGGSAILSPSGTHCVVAGGGGFAGGDASFGFGSNLCSAGRGTSFRHSSLSVVNLTFSSITQPEHGYCRVTRIS